MKPEKTKEEMENGEGNFESKFAGLTLTDPYNVNGSDGLFQVMKAVEAAEATIKQQVEENNRLRSELQMKNDELVKYKSGNAKYQNPQSGDRWGDLVNESCRTDQIVSNLGNQISGAANMMNSGSGLAHSAVLQTDLIRINKDLATRSHMENQFDTNKVNGSLNAIHGDEIASDNCGLSRIMSPSITLFTPNSYQQENSSESELRYSARDSNFMDEMNNTSSSKQDIVVKIREHEEEISQLKRHLTEFSIKESQICNEKYALEKRISYMRLAFDQQQQDLVLAASKAISYRQDIMEENVRLTYALQAAQQERSTFVTSLMPLLAEYSLQPPVADAQSIVSNVKVLFRHLQEQLLVTEGKLKESHYQLAPWRSDANPSNFAQSPLYPIKMKDGLELVPQAMYSDGKMPSSDPQTAMVGDISGFPQSGFDSLKNLEHDELGTHPPLTSRNTASHEAPSPPAFSQADPHRVPKNEGTISKKVTFGDLVRGSEMDEPYNGGRQTDGEPSVNLTYKTVATSLDDPNSSYSPYLSPVLEEPSSSFSEAADDDPLPAIEGLQISGEAFPGQQLQACGYSINGTTSCNFEWVRHLEDGSFNYVDGAKQPNYLVTADDVDTYLAIEVQPLDDRKRKGELVKVFANEHQKITCDPSMLNCIEETLYNGHASYKLYLSTGYLDIWEPATLSIKRDAYSIKCSRPSGVVAAEKFSKSTIVSIPYGSATDFSIIDSLETQHILRVDSNLTDISGSRDTIVLTLRLFILKAGEKKKGRKRSLFFNK